MNKSLAHVSAVNLKVQLTNRCRKHQSHSKLFRNRSKADLSKVKFHALNCASKPLCNEGAGNSILRKKQWRSHIQLEEKLVKGTPVSCRASADKTPVGVKISDENVWRERIITAGYIALWYAVNVAFNLTNKSLFKSFPFPWTVSTVHVLIGTIYCIITYMVGMKNASFGRPVTTKEFLQISAPASMHALGHIAANLSFAAVAISLTHTVKTLEPAFSVVLQWTILGIGTPFPVLLSLVPIIAGVGLASAAELSFNWLGFSSAMLSNITFGFRAVLSKKTMADLTDLSSTSLYAYTTLISLLICAPLALIMEGPMLKAGVDAAIEKLGMKVFGAYLIAIGLFYHLYNQFAFNTLARVSPVSHGVCNVVKRIIIIGSSVMFFGNVLSRQTIIGTAIALIGTAVYTDLQTKSKMKK